MSWLLPAVTANLCGSIILFSVYACLYRQERDRALQIWTASWGLYALRFLFMLPVVQGYADAAFIIGNQLAALGSGLLLLHGTLVFSGTRFPAWLFLPFAVTVVWTVASALYGLPLGLVSIPCFGLLGIAYILTGLVILRRSPDHGLSRLIVGWAFILWGIHKFDYPILRGWDAAAPWGYLLAVVFELTTAVGILMMYLEHRSRAREDEAAA